MKSAHDLRSRLTRIDQRSYRAYRELLGSYSLGDFVLSIDRVQADPFAAPSRLSLSLDRRTSAIPAKYCQGPIRSRALGDFLTRSFGQACRLLAQGQRGSGKSGVIAMATGGQEVLERNSIVVSAKHIEARFRLGLPAVGRRVLADQARSMLLEEIPAIARASLFYGSLDTEALRRHVLGVEDQVALREQLENRGLVAFVADSACLPRASGVDQRPLSDAGTVKFQSPASLRLELNRPNAGPIRGMGIPTGITLIVGGGFHGKSTLLQALERGVYDHVPGDGRENVVTVDHAVKIKAEGGRSVKALDISAFVGTLPGKRSTTAFQTRNASGSTSQASNLMEALECGSRLLLIDEDTSATNFMIRDSRMQRLVAAGDEPITPLLDRAREMVDQLQVSLIVVTGGSGDYFEVADRVLLMKEYQAFDVTGRARDILSQLPSRRQLESRPALGLPRSRYPCYESLVQTGGRRLRIDAPRTNLLRLGAATIDLSGLEQLVDEAQSRCIGEALYHAYRAYAGQSLTLKQLLEHLEDEFDRRGVDAVSRFKNGELARPRIYELAGAINRLRNLRLRQPPTARDRL